METATVGKVVVPVIIENQFDYERACEGADPGGSSSPHRVSGRAWLTPGRHSSACRSR